MCTPRHPLGPGSTTGSRPRAAPAGDRVRPVADLCQTPTKFTCTQLEVGVVQCRWAPAAAPWAAPRRPARRRRFSGTAKRGRPAAARRPRTVALAATCAGAGRRAAGAALPSLQLEAGTRWHPGGDKTRTPTRPEPEPASGSLQVPPAAPGRRGRRRHRDRGRYPRYPPARRGRCHWQPTGGRAALAWRAVLSLEGATGTLTVTGVDSVAPSRDSTKRLGANLHLQVG